MIVGNNDLYYERIYLMSERIVKREYTPSRYARVKKKREYLEPSEYETV